MNSIDGKRAANTLLTALLVVAVVAVNLVVIRIHSVWTQPIRGATDLHYLTISGSGIGLGLAQYGLVISWVVLEQGRIVLRIAVSLVASVGAAAFVAKFSANPATEWLGVMALYGMEVAMIWLVLTYLGFQVKLSNGIVRTKSSRQFSLGHLLTLITAVSLYCALLRWARFPWRHTLEVVSFCTGFTIITVACIRTIATASRPNQSCVRLIVMSAVIGLMTGWIGREITASLVVCLALAVSTLAIVLVMRVNGSLALPQPVRLK